MPQISKMKYADIHSHFLYGVDDGAANQINALDMLEQAVDTGITHILATPHATDLTNDEVSKRFQNHFTELQKLVSENNIPVKTGLAAELFFSTKIYDWLKYPWSTFNNNRKYLLFELPLFELPQHVQDFIFQCRLEGLTPILAHPERYGYLHQLPDTLLKWHHQGCFMQVNAGSITGQFGSRVQNMALRLLQAGLVQFVASDAHETENRNYRQLTDARQILSNQYNATYLNDLFYNNPLNAIEGRQVEAGPLHEEMLLQDLGLLAGWAQKIRKVFHL